MAALTADQRRIVQALQRDIAATLAPADAAALASDVEWHAADVAQRFDWARHDVCMFAAELVEDVQQRIHDEFIDVSWPRCPNHPNHPLWLQGGEWWCPHDSVATAPLGELPARRASP